MKRSFGHVILCAALVGGASTALAAPSSIERAAVVASVDEDRGVPTIVWASPSQQPVVPTAKSGSPQEAARWYLEQYAPLYKLSLAAQRTAAVSHVHDTGRGGIIVRFEQTVDGVPVARTRLNVLMRRHGLQLVALTGNLHHAAIANASRTSRTFKVGPADAIATAFSEIWQLPTAATDMRASGFTKAGFDYFEMTPTGQIADAKLTMLEPARIKRVMFPVGDALVPAYYLELITGHVGTRNAKGHGYFIAADDGRVLEARSLVDHDSFNYTVFAHNDALFTPTDGPQEDYTPHPAGFPDGSRPAFITPIQVTMEGFNTNPDGLPDPWLDALATETVGNNVDAYTDHTGVDGFDEGIDIRADLTAANTFDYTYDTSLPPLDSEDQMKAAVVQLFYVNNWLHDFFYDSGFDEAAGNAQALNFGRGGVEGDVLRAEAQDGAEVGSRNNANMLTPADGTSPRMQMFLWNGPDIRTLDALGQALENGTAAFGPLDFDITAELALVDDGAGDSPTDGCEPLVNDGEVTGRIALIDRGSCSFASKAQNAEDAGAIAVIIANNAPGAGVINMANQTPPLTIGIPAMMVTFEDGDAMKVELAENPVSVTMSRVVEIERDGTIDNHIVAHEWGHYIHRRLVGCGNAQCGAMSEGWGDFIALFMVIAEGDDFNTGSYAVGIYGPETLHESPYFGIRRVAYSVDTAKNSLSFRHISNDQTLPGDIPLSGTFSGNPNAQVHNAGEVWATMMMNAYVALLNESLGPEPRYTFTEARRRMADYVVAGLKLTPGSATYTEGRDGILAAAAANDILDAQLMAAAFSSRGAGTCARSPSRGSTDFIGTEEAFGDAANMRLVDVTLDGDAVRSCDTDGLLDADEKGLLNVSVQNTGLAPLVDTKVIVTSNTPGIRFPDGTSVTLDDVAAFETGTVQVLVELDENVELAQDFDFDITLLNGNTCVFTDSGEFSTRGNFDSTPEASATDNVESPFVVWAETTEIGTENIWTRIADPDDSNNHFWHGIDNAANTDTSLESPVLEVSGDEPLVITLQHRYSFEADALDNFDGGVIELSTDGGTTWEDVTTFGADPGYTGTLVDFNPLGEREALTGNSPGFPAFAPMVLEFGTQFAGQSVMLRFRIGCDPAVGAPGWDVDDIQVVGIDNTPFPVLDDDQADCLGIPTALAGDDATVPGGTMVTLDASASSDPENDPLTFEWAQIDGPRVELDSTTSAAASFVAPEVGVETALTFQVTVADADASAMDEVVITVLAGNGPDGGVDPGDDIGGDETGGCGCQAGSDTPAGTASMLLLLGGVIAILRRRTR